MTSVVALDPSGRVLHANRAAEALIGDGGTRLEGRPIWSTLPEPQRRRLQAACERAREESQTVEIETPWRREDRWYRLQVFPIGDNLSVHIRDVTADRRRKDELELRERALREACRAVTDREADPRQRVKRLLTDARGVVGTEFATLSYVDTDEEAYHFDAVGERNETALPEGEAIDLDELPICAKVAREDTALVLRDVEDEAPDLADPAWGITAYVGAPVHVGGDVYGTFCFYSTERRSEAFTDWEVTYVELLSDLAAAELERMAAGSRPIDPPIVSGSSANGA